MAVAIVFAPGTATRSVRWRQAVKSGFAPSAWTTAILGSLVSRPSSRSSSRPFARAVLLPRLPPGRTSQSGTCQPRSWSSSKAMAFWPSMWNGLTEFSR